MRTQAQVSISVTPGGDLSTMAAEVFCTGDTTFHILSPVTQIRRLLSLLWYAECARGGLWDGWGIPTTSPEAALVPH